MKQIVIEIDDDYFALSVHDVERDNNYKPLKIIINDKLFHRKHGKRVKMEVSE